LYKKNQMKTVNFIKYIRP